MEWLQTLDKELKGNHHPPTALPGAQLSFLNTTDDFSKPGVPPSLDSRRTVSIVPSKSTSDDEKSQLRKKLARAYARKSREKKRNQEIRLRIELHALHEENAQLRNALDVILRLAEQMKST
jgi:hypothetical protein